MRDTRELLAEKLDSAEALAAAPISVEKAAAPGLRADNKWITYDPSFIATESLMSDADETMAGKEEEEEEEEEECAKWESACFLDKSYWAYYGWPANMPTVSHKRDVYSTTTIATTRSEQNAEEQVKNELHASAIQPIVDKFAHDAQFVAKFIQLSTIEESKGSESFDKQRFHFFKALFRNFGTASIFHELFEHLERLVADKRTMTHEMSAKLAAEIVSGLIRGSKYWPYVELRKLWRRLRPLLDKIIDSLTNENLQLWYDCFSNSFVSRSNYPLFSPLLKLYLYNLSKLNDIYLTGL